MLHLRNKSHLSSSKASQLAFQSNLISDTTFGAFMAAENLSKEEKNKQQRDEARNALRVLETSIMEINKNSEITEAALKEVSSKAGRILVGRIIEKPVSKLGLSADEKKRLDSLGDIRTISFDVILKNFK